MSTETGPKDTFACAPHVRITDAEFCRLGEFIERQYGIKMPPVKKIMIESRLQKRLKLLGMRSFAEYSSYLFSPAGIQDELHHMVDMVTTNKTDFFREPAHFGYLASHTLPELEAHSGAGLRRPLKLWSAGCSTGEEPYTLAMVLSEYAGRRAGFRFNILASDISTRVLDAAREAVYDEERVAPVPVMLKHKYLLRSRERERRKVRIVPALRNTVGFMRINFMDADYGLRDRFDIIFCRNVIIYFDRPAQERLLQRFVNEYLLPGGYLFMGHSETLSGLNISVRPVAPTVYRKPG